MGALCIECGRIDDEVEKIILLRRKRGEYGSWLVWSAHGECGHWQMSTIHARVVFIGYQVHIMLPASDRVRRQKPEERHGETARTYRRLGRGAHPFGSGSYGSQSHLMWSTQEVAIIRGLVQKLRMPVRIRTIWQSITSNVVDTRSCHNTRPGSKVEDARSDQDHIAVNHI